MEMDKQELEIALKKYKNCNRVGKVIGLMYSASFLYLAEYNRQHGITDTALWENLVISGGVGFGIYAVFDSLRGLSMQNMGELTRHVGNLFGYAFTKPLGFHKTAEGFTKRLSKTEKDPISKQAFLAHLDMQNGKVDIAFERYDSIVRALGDNKYPRGILEKMARPLSTIPIYLFEKKDISYYLSKALIDLLDGRTDKCKKNLEKAIEIEIENKAEINLLYAYFLNMVGEPEKALPHFENAADLIRRDETLVFEPLGESKNEVKVVEGGKYISKGFVVKRNENLEHLLGERGIIDCVAEWADSEKLNLPLGMDNQKWQLPLHVGGIELKEEKYESLMVREIIATLHQRLLEDHPDLENNILDACDFLVHIYKSVPLSILEPEKDEIPSVVKSLQDIGMDMGAIMDLIEDLEPVLEGFEDSPLVYRKDPHFLNWGVRPDGKIVALDFEPAPAIRLEKDLARFTDMFNLPRILKEKAHKRVIWGLDSNRNLKKSKLLLYKSAIINALKSYSVLSKGKTRIEIRKTSMKNANLNLANIEQEYGEHYFGNEKQYVGLGNKLVKLS